jgi:hypothetical protein
MVSLDTSIVVAKDVVFRELDGEAVILNLESGMYFGLDAVGTRIWQLCDQHGSLRAVLAAMQHEFDAPGETLRVDLLALVDQLASKGLITLQD